MKRKKKVKIGLDFDGVVAYNPFRVARPIIAFVKKDIFRIKRLKFWYPKKRWQQLFWIILHETSVFPAPGCDLIKQMAKNRNVEFHLITGRYSFLRDHLDAWLEKYGLNGVFKSINLNINDEQPFIFKEKTIKKLKIDFFVEDNWDIASYLNRKKNCCVYWVYNLIDRKLDFPNKVPYLKKALIEIKVKNRINTPKA